MHNMKYIELQRKLITLKYSYANLNVLSNNNMCASFLMLKWQDLVVGLITVMWRRDQHMGCKDIHDSTGDNIATLQLIIEGDATFQLEVHKNKGVGFFLKQIDQVLAFYVDTKFRISALGGGWRSSFHETLWSLETARTAQRQAEGHAVLCIGLHPEVAPGE